MAAPRPPRRKRITRLLDGAPANLTAEQRLLPLHTSRRSSLPAGDFAALVDVYADYHKGPRTRAGPAGMCRY
jgi:hypothetical protein